MSLKREIVLLAGEKGLKDLDHTTDVHIVGKHNLKSLPKEACHLNTRERLMDTLLDAIKHPSYDS